MLSRYSSLLLLLLVFLNACQSGEGSESVEDAPRTPRPWKLVCLGGSTTIGVGVNPEAAFPARLQQLLASEEHPVKVVNAGLRGETIAGAEARLAWILQQRLDAFLFALGESAVDQRLSPEEKEAHWRGLLSTLRNAYPDIPVFILLLPGDMDKSSTSDWWRSLELDYQLEVLRPDWSVWQDQAETELNAAGHEALARWLQEKLGHLPQDYYQQNKEG